MKLRMSVIIAGLLLFVAGACSHKEDPYSPLTGTCWECLEEPEFLVFNDYRSGVYYGKGAVDGVYDAIYSSFDFTYEISGNNIAVRIFFSNFDSSYDFVIEDDETLTCGRFHYKKIQHK